MAGLLTEAMGESGPMVEVASFSDQLELSTFVSLVAVTTKEQSPTAGCPPPLF